MKKRWINIPSPRYPVTLIYLIMWVLAPLKPFLFTNLLNISNKRCFQYIFNFLNLLIIHWPLKIKYQAKEDMFKVYDKKNKIFIARRQYLKLYSKGIKSRNDLLTNQYFLNTIDFNKNDFVIDVGANIGEVSLILAKDFQCKILSIEPEEKEFNCLKFNLNGFDSNYINVPLWSEEKEISFYSANEDLDSSCFETEGYTEIVKKNALTLSKIIKDFNIEKIKFLKLEAEGAEPEILLGGLKDLNKIEYICVDVGPERGLKYETTLVETVNILKTNNFEFLKMGHPRLNCLFKNKDIPK